MEMDEPTHNLGFWKTGQNEFDAQVRNLNGIFL